MINDTYFEQALRGAVRRLTEGGTPPGLARAIDHAVFPGGARIRPKICLAVAQACGGDCPDLTLRAAAALEMMHCASLAFDDLPCFDDATMRRGKLSTHIAFGEPLAVLAGNALIVGALAGLLDPPSPDGGARTGRLVALLAEASAPPIGICAGQAWESEPVIDTGLYHRTKAGALFVAACRMGATSVGAEDDAWEELGQRLGEAYQVADDIKDVGAAGVVTGKPAGQDQRHGRPSRFKEDGPDGAAQRFERLVASAIEAIPHCSGEAWLCQLIGEEARRLVPPEPTANARPSRADSDQSGS